MHKVIYGCIMPINMRWFEVLIKVLMIQIFRDLTPWWQING